MTIRWTAAVLTLTLACGGSSTPTSAPTPAPTPTPSATFTIVGATPAAGGTVSLPPTPGEGSRSPTVDFQFTYPRDLTLGVGNTNFQVALSKGSVECMATQIAYSTRLDRDDGVYVANSVARFRTGFWVQRDIAQYPMRHDLHHRPALVQHGAEPSRQRRPSGPGEHGLEFRRPLSRLHA